MVERTYTPYTPCWLTTSQTIICTSFAHHLIPIHNKGLPLHMQESLVRMCMDYKHNKKRTGHSLGYITVTNRLVWTSSNNAIHKLFIFTFKCHAVADLKHKCPTMAIIQYQTIHYLIFLSGMRLQPPLWLRGTDQKYRILMCTYTKRISLCQRPT